MLDSFYLFVEAQKNFYCEDEETLLRENIREY